MFECEISPLPFMLETKKIEIEKEFGIYIFIR